jgi:hypothetical protein
MRRAQCRMTDKIVGTNLKYLIADSNDSMIREYEYPFFRAFV